MRRSQWLTFRSTLSNWLTDTESEEKRKVSLSRSTETFSQSPLLMGGAIEVIGLVPFGLLLVNQSRFISHLVVQELLDTLATEDLNSICTEDGDEITLG